MEKCQSTYWLLCCLYSIKSGPSSCFFSFFDILCRYGPPTRTDYRIVVENISSRVSWQVSFFVVCVFHIIFSLLILSRKCFRLFICVFDFVCQSLTHLLHLLSKACYVLEGLDYGCACVLSDVFCVTWGLFMAFTLTPYLPT